MLVIRCLLLRHSRSSLMEKEIFMALAIVYSRASLGIEAPLVTVEVHISNGLPYFGIVGLPETSVKESRERVRSAIGNSGFEFPMYRITVNLAPADLPKDGGRFDLPIAIGILAASGQIAADTLNQFEFVGELALSGEIRPVRGEIPFVYACRKAERVGVLPAENAPAAALVEGINILGVSTLADIYQHLVGLQTLAFWERSSYSEASNCYSIDMSDVIGQPMAKRALEIAACGGHNLLFLGPAGTGKSMLAQRLVTILPELSESEALEVAAIRSICGEQINPQNWKVRPFRTPHHTCSAVALVGGGSNPKPGEISLSHKGVLFLDELAEYERKVLDVLREPLETGVVTISRAANRADFPADFQLIAAMNPSPTGHHEDGRASPEQVLRYLNRISGPFIDRIDIQLDVPRLPKGALTNSVSSGETSVEIRKRVIRARQVQYDRANKANAELSSTEVSKYCSLTAENASFLENAIEKLHLSTRAFHKILKVSRTIADLAGSEVIEKQHLAEALGYRAMDRLLISLKKA